MNNEETIVMKPQNNNNKAEKTQNVEIAEKESNKGKKVAATATAAVMGGAVGSGATYAATTMLHDKEAEEQKPEDEAQTTEESVVAAAEEPQKEQQTEAPKEEEVAVKLDAAESAEPDYTGAHHADPVTPNPEVHAAVDETSNSDTNEVQVLGVYEAQGENGQTMQAAVLTNGEDVAAVIDVDGDGVANVLVVDENHNQQIDEGEVYDLSNEHVQMADYQQAYLAQQQEQMQQEHDTFAYNASDDQQDYNNDVDRNMYKMVKHTLLTLLLALLPVVCQAKIYLLSVGISDYPGKQNDLRLPHNDAATMQWLYKQNSQAKVCLLMNDKAKVATVKKALQKMVALATEDDIVVMFFSGHGVKGGFVCYDGFLYYNDIYSAMGACKSRNKMIFADACFSGAMRQENSSSQNGSTHKNSNVMLFLSCRSNEKSIETPKMTNGFFTYALQHGLRGGADTNKDRIITAKELFDYVSAKVKKESNNRQHPVMWGKFSNNMPVMKW